MRDGGDDCVGSGEAGEWGHGQQVPVIEVAVAMGKMSKVTAVADGRNRRQDASQTGRAAADPHHGG